MDERYLGPQNRAGSRHLAHCFFASHDDLVAVTMRMPVMRVLLVTSNSHGCHGRAMRQFDLETFPFEQRQTPATFLALPVDMLSTHSAPEEVIVGECFPGFRNLRGATEGDGIEVAEDAKVDFSGEKRERVYADDLVERVGEVGELRAERQYIKNLGEKGERTYKQHIVRMPSRMSFRRGCLAFEKVAQS